jgi:hypothetical protein
MPKTDITLNELRSLRQQATEKLSFLSSEYDQLLESDPIAAAKKAEEGRLFLQTLDDVDGSIVEYSDKLQSKLADGSFLTEDIDTITGGIPVTSDQITKKLSDGLSALYEAPVDLTSGLGANDRKNLAFFRDQGKDEYLAKEYGAENVKTLNILGSPMRLVRNQDGTLVAADELGFSAKDVIDGIGVPGPIAGGIIGNAFGIALQSSPFGAAIGGAAGYTFFASLQDAAARKALDVGPGFLDAIPERATEAMIGLPIEYGTMKVLTPIGLGIQTARKGKVSKRQKILEQDEAYLKSRGYDINLSKIASGSSEKARKRLQTAQSLPNYLIGRDVLFGVKRLERIKDNALSGVQRSNAMYEDTLDALRHERNVLENTIALYDKDMAKSVGLAYDDDIYKFINRPRQDREGAGAYFFEELKSARKAADDIKNDTYNPFYQNANSVVSENPIALAKAIESEYYSGLPRNSALEIEIQNLYQRPKNAKRISEIDSQISKGKITADEQDALLRERLSLEQLSGDLNAKQLDDLVAIFREAVPEGTIVGGTRKQGVAGRAARTIEEIRNDAYQQAGLLDEWNAATSVYRQRLGFNEQALGSLIKETLGRSDLTGSQIVKKIFSDPRNVDDVLKAVALKDPQNSYRVGLSLQQAYLQDIGIGGAKSSTLGEFDFDPEIVTKIFGFDKDGNLNQIYGQRMVQKLENLQNQVKKANVDPSKINEAELLELQGVLSQTSIDELTGRIVDRLKAQKEVDLFKTNSLLDAASKGHREVIERGEFPEALWSSPPDKVRKILAKFGTKDQEMLRGDYIEHFFGKYPASADATIGDVTLWDGRRFLQDIAKKPSIERNLRAIVGNEFADDIISASRMMEVISRVPTKETGNIGSGVVNEAGVKWYSPVRAIVNPVKHRVAGAAYRVQRGKLFQKYLKDVGRKELTPEQYMDETYKLLGGLMTTTSGIQAMTQSGKYDPEWSAALGQLIGTVPKETVEYREKYGTE